MLEFLKPFKQATAEFSTENTASLQAVYPTYIKLKNACTVTDVDEDAVEEMKTNAKNYLENCTCANIEK